MEYAKQRAMSHGPSAAMKTWPMLPIHPVAFFGADYAGIYQRAEPFTGGQ
jgi:hypothetical protein